MNRYDSVYQQGPFELRGEYLSLTREMPGNLTDDKRDGWYLQAAYQLSGLTIPLLDRTELVARWDGSNQNSLTQDQHDSDFLRKPRQVALGMNYWFTPSVVWKLEYDRIIPAEASNSNAILTEVAVGF